MLRQMKAVFLVAAMSLAACATARAENAAPDEDALRYYASLGQKDRVAAEIRRLTRLYPSWHAPDDLAAVKPGRADEAPLWSLYADKNFAALQAAIAVREAAEPGWHPSDDLQDKIKATALRAAILQLTKAGDWRGIVAQVKLSGTTWAARDAEVLWAIAEAYARENDCMEAYIVYRGLLTNHADVSERIATIQRAIAMLPMASVEKLVDMGRVGADGRNEFDAIAMDITRARISAILHDDPGKAVAGPELDAFKAYVKTIDDPNQPALVAWLAFKRADYREALDWFKLSIAQGGDAMVAHGLAHTLRKLGMKREAEEVAYAWREPLVNNAILFIDLLEEDFTKDTPPFIEPARVARYAQVTTATGSGEGAQALGWYAYNTCQYPLALEWFQRAVAWLPKEATVYGYALTLQRMKRARDFREVVNRYDGLFPKVVALAFDDGRTRQPPPCEASPGSPSAPPREASGFEASTAQGPTMADTLNQTARAAQSTPAQLLAVRYARARVPLPDAAGLSPDTPVQTLVKKTEFPVSVAPENSLRFSALRTNASEDQTRVAAGQKGPGMPLVARRVPGVGAMPYERFGFILQPGWDGTREPSVPSAADRQPPLGTLSSFAQSLRDGGRDQMRQGDDQPREAPPGVSAEKSSSPGQRS